ncbi:MAG TPA: glycosyltransferase family 2 protein [Dehalococcoidia bacterium]|nr:glycosyltransferase family 2 protein [Dehalococcoidia bacterium]
MSDAPSVGIVVVNYNSAAFIDEFLASLAAVRYENRHLTVVDAGSDDGSVETIARTLPDAEIIRCGENVGFARGANIGVKACAAREDDFVLFLNNDVALTPDFLGAMIAAADARTLVVPKILYYDDRRLISTHAGGFDWRLGVFRRTYAGRPDGPATSVRREDLQTASFCCALVPLRAFRDAGPLDETFFMYYEETDFIRRAQACGYRVRYEPSAVVYHRESGSSGGGWITPFKQYYATRNRLYLVRKHRRSRLAYAWFTAYFWATRIATSARLAATGRWRLLRAMWRGTLDYYRGRMGRTLQVRDL